ncbi:hypothetical protein BBJ28_00008750 [Nothophytophthora sp. Chile5]|nr:hypothetical protein BBJ28_00008750 [Nothophytophthora sp. Chile5]
MCVTDLPGDPDGVLVLHDVMELVDEAYEPGESSTASASPIVFDSDDEDLDVPPLRPRGRRRHPPRDHEQQLAGCTADSDDASASVTSLAALPVLDGAMLDYFTSDEAEEEAMGGVYHGVVTAKLKQGLAGEEWRVKPTITNVSLHTAAKPKPKVTAKVSKSTPRHRPNPKDEVVYLRERVRQMEQTLETLRLQALADKEKALETAIVFNLVPQPDLLVPAKNTNWTPGSPEQTTNKSNVNDQAGSPAGVDAVAIAPNSPEVSNEGLWGRIATFQKAEYQKSMRQNKRLRTLAEQQLRALKQLEVAFRNPRAQLFRGSLFDSEAAIFESLRVELETQYRETDAIFRSMGLTSFEGDMARTAVPRATQAVEGIFLENTECKVFPFNVDAVDHAVWHCLADTNAEFHPGLYQIREVTEDVVAVKISDSVHLPMAETVVTVWLTVKRFRERMADGGTRVICVWNAMVETDGSLKIRLQERGWNVLRPLTHSSTCVEPNRAMSLTQTCMRVSPLARVEFDVCDLAVGTLANVLVGCYHRTVIVMHHVLEKLLLTEFKALS